MNKFKIGQEVFYIELKVHYEKIICECCNGTKFVTVIFGDGKQYELECRGCEKGYEGAQGYNDILQYKSKIEKVNIKGLEIRPSGEITYYLDNYCGVPEDRLTDKLEEANKLSEQIQKEYNDRQKELFFRKDKLDKSWSWHATYHRKEISRAKKSIEYHESKLKFVKEKIKLDKQK